MCIEDAEVPWEGLFTFGRLSWTGNVAGVFLTHYGDGLGILTKGKGETHKDSCTMDDVRFLVGDSPGDGPSFVLSW